MRSRLGPSLALSLSLALAACSPEVGQEDAPISVDPSCLLADTKLYPAVGFGGTPICLTGSNGAYMLPRGFDTKSFLAGVNRICFTGAGWPTEEYQPGDVDAYASAAVIHASTISILNDAGGVDGGACN